MDSLHTCLQQGLKFSQLFQNKAIHWIKEAFFYADKRLGLTKLIVYF